MINKKYIHKNLKGEYPELNANLILQTKSDAHYVWEGYTLKKYCYSEFYGKNIKDGIKNPLIIQGDGYWATDVLIAKDFGDYLGIIMPQVRCLRVGDFKDKAKTKFVPNGDVYFEYRIYKNRKVARVSIMPFEEENCFLVIQENKAFQWNRYIRHIGLLPNPTSLMDPRTEEFFNDSDADGNPRYLLLTDEDIKASAVNITKAKSEGWTPSTFYAMDYNLGVIHPIRNADHGTKSMEFAPKTKEIVRNFFQDGNCAINSMSDLLEFIKTPNTQKTKNKKEADKAQFEKFCQELGWNKQDKGLVFDRKGDIIYVTCFRDASSERYSWGKKGLAVLEYNTKRKTKSLYVYERGKAPKKIISSLNNILKWFNIMPNIRVKPGVWVNGTSRYITEVDPEDAEIAYWQDPVYKKPAKEIFAGTNIGLFMESEGVPFSMYWGYGQWHFQAVTGIKTLQDSLQYCGESFWTILFSGTIIEQLFKQKLAYLALAIIKQEQTLDLDTKAGNAQLWWTNDRIGFHSKAKNAKSSFGLTTRQLQMVNNYIREGYKCLLERQNGFSTIGERPMIPSLIGAEEVLGTPLSAIDDKTFSQLLDLSSLPANTGWFTWKKLDSCVYLKTLYQGESAKNIINWISKGFNLQLYNDYLAMRMSLKRIGEGLHQPEIFSEVAFPVKVKTPDELVRLHDAIAAIHYEHKNAVESAAFSSAVQDAQKFVFTDDDSVIEADRMMVVTPRSVADLITEGTQLHHCVKSSMWVDAIARRESIILFIRKCMEPNTPYFTVELDPKGAIRQCHGQSNCNPTQEVLGFLQRWADAHKGVLKESISSHYGALCAPRY